MGNAFSQKIESLSVASRPQAPWMYPAALAARLSHSVRSWARSFTFRMLIALAPEFIHFRDRSPSAELWRIATEMRNHLKAVGYLLIWGEKWVWNEGEPIPVSVEREYVYVPRKMFRF